MPRVVVKAIRWGFFCVADVVAEVYRAWGAADGVLRQVMAVEGAPSLCFREAYFHTAMAAIDETDDRVMVKLNGLRWGRKCGCSYR